MKLINRLLGHPLLRVLSEGKSILLLGPRQSGKTHLLDLYLSTDLSYDLLDASIRLNFEQNPDSLIEDIKYCRSVKRGYGPILVRIDELYKVPALLKQIQYAIVHKLAIFILSTSSMRKLSIPSTILELRMEALSLDELADEAVELQDLLLYGSLPSVIAQSDKVLSDTWLKEYIESYLMDIRAESLIRNTVHFARFLKHAALRSGEIANISLLSEEAGIARPTVNEYYQICEDTLMVERVDPITYTHLNRRLSKTPKYLFFDLGVRRVAAGEAAFIPEKYYNDLFKQWIGLELLKLLRAIAPVAKLYYWKDHNGPEVDYVIEYQGYHIPIEVQYKDKPALSDAKHLQVFQNEYDCLPWALVICRVEPSIQLNESTLAIHWRELSSTLRKLMPSMHPVSVAG